MDDEKLKDLRVKHLEFIQASIARMGQNSFQMKNWTIVVLAALVVLYVENKSVVCLFALLIATVVFWFLDGYYLYQEKRFRDLYDAVARGVRDEHIGAGNDEVPLFSMDPVGRYGFVVWVECVISGTEFWMYAPIVFGTVFAIVHYFLSI